MMRTPASYVTGKLRVEREINKAVGKRMEGRAGGAGPASVALAAVAAAAAATTATSTSMDQLSATDLRGVSVRDMIRLIGKTNPTLTHYTTEVASGGNVEQHTGRGTASGSP